MILYSNFVSTVSKNTKKVRISELVKTSQIRDWSTPNYATNTLRIENILQST